MFLANNFHYGANGNPVNWERWAEYNYTPDRLNRQSVTDNGTVTNYTPDGVNQYTSVGNAGLSYDGNFNQTTDPAGHSFVYNAQNQLVGGSLTATYDGLGRCVRRATSGGTRLYTYDDWNPIVEWDQGGNFTGWNMYGARPDEILMRYDAVQGPLVYKQDQHGNVVALLDQWGNIVERYTYDAFGKPKVTGFWDDNDRGGSWYGNRFMFQGREWIGELGIYDYRHRMYQPQLGRFLQTDPTGFDAGDMNLFRYCGDDPVDKSDPEGVYETPAGGWENYSGGKPPSYQIAEYHSQMQNQPAGNFSFALLSPDKKEASNDSNASTKLTRKLEPGFSVDTYDKNTGTIWIHRRWVYTLSTDSGPVVGVRLKEKIKMTNMKDYKDFPRKFGSEVTDRYGRVYDNWRLGFSSKNGQVTVTQALFIPGATGTAVHTVTIGASNGGWHQFNNPKNEEDPVPFK